MSTTRLKPTAPNARDAILVGDPGRALALAQVVIEEPKMSNHARGLWGYTSAEVRGGLTVQSTGMGGPSAAAVLGDLAQLGVKRAVRVGTCRSIDEGTKPGEIVAVKLVHGLDGTSRALSPDGAIGAKGESVALEPNFPADLHRVTCVSLDLDPAVRELEELRSASGGVAADVADMQTAALAACARSYGVEFGALLIVEWGPDGERLGTAELEGAVGRAGALAAENLRELNLN